MFKIVLKSRDFLIRGVFTVFSFTRVIWLPTYFSDSRFLSFVMFQIMSECRNRLPIKEYPAIFAIQTWITRLSTGWLFVGAPFGVGMMLCRNRFFFKKRRTFHTDFLLMSVLITSRRNIDYPPAWRMLLFRELNVINLVITSCASIVGFPTYFATCWLLSFMVNYIVL